MSCTTRKPRVGETPDVDYHFVSEKEFRAKIEDGEFLEWAEVHGNLYGTPASAVAEELANGKDVMLVIDVQGALRVKEKRPESVLVFVEPPSFGDLRERLTGRGTESPDVIEKRIKRAEEEMKCRSRYDYKIINDSLDKAVDELVLIVEGERDQSTKKSK